MEKITYEKLLLSERVNNLFNQPIILILSSQAVLMLLTSWYFKNTVSQTFLISWFSVGITATFLMMFLVIAFRRSVRTPEKSKHWLKLFLLAVLTDGIVWGSLAIYPPVFDSVTNVMLVAIMLLGVIAAALPVMSSFSSFFYIFSILTLSPMTFRFFYIGDTLYTTLGSMYLLYLGVQILSSKNMQTVTLNSLRLGFENI